MVSSKPPGPLQQFLCPLQKINSCLETSHMAAGVPVQLDQTCWFLPESIFPSLQPQCSVDLPASGQIGCSVYDRSSIRAGAGPGREGRWTGRVPGERCRYNFSSSRASARPKRAHARSLSLSHARGLRSAALYIASTNYSCHQRGRF